MQKLSQLNQVTSDEKQRARAQELLQKYKALLPQRNSDQNHSLSEVISVSSGSGSWFLIKD